MRALWAAIAACAPALAQTQEICVRVSEWECRRWSSSWWVLFSKATNRFFTWRKHAQMYARPPVRVWSCSLRPQTMMMVIVMWNISSVIVAWSNVKYTCITTIRLHLPGSQQEWAVIWTNNCSKTLNFFTFPDESRNTVGRFQFNLQLQPFGLLLLMRKWTNVHRKQFLFALQYFSFPFRPNGQIEC